MGKTLTSLLALAAGLSISGAALAQASGGPDAKGNAPLKPAHTVNDGTAKRGANSFTEKQAQEHIEKSGFNAVTGLAKGDDGVWRGQAMRNGVTTDVAMDFKGNVSTSGGMSPHAPGAMSTTRTTSVTRSHGSSAAVASAHHRHRHHHVACSNPAPNGAACSGVDHNLNGISDREDRAVGSSAHP